MRGDDPFGLPRRAAGVDDQGPSPLIHPHPRAACGLRGMRQRLVRSYHPKSLHRTESPNCVGEVRVRDDDLRLRVLDHVLQLGGRMRGSERNRDAAGPPDAPLRCHVVPARGHEERDPRLHEIRAAVQEARGDALRRLDQVSIGERALGGDDRGAALVRQRAGHDGEIGSGHRATLQRPAARGQPLGPGTEVALWDGAASGEVSEADGEARHARVVGRRAHRVVGLAGGTAVPVARRRSPRAARSGTAAKLAAASVVDVATVVL